LEGSAEKSDLHLPENAADFFISFTGDF